MHDVCDEEVEDYFRKQLQVDRVIALEDDEFMFWKKLYYHLHTNDEFVRVLPDYKPNPIDITKDHSIRSNDDISFDKYSIRRPMIDMDSKHDKLFYKDEDDECTCDDASTPRQEIQWNPSRTQLRGKCTCAERKANDKPEPCIKSSEPKCIDYHDECLPRPARESQRDPCLNYQRDYLTRFHSNSAYRRDSDESVNMDHRVTLKENNFNDGDSSSQNAFYEANLQDRNVRIDMNKFSRRNSRENSFA